MTKVKIELYKAQKKEDERVNFTFINTTKNKKLIEQTIDVFINESNSLENLSKEVEEIFNEKKKIIRDKVIFIYLTEEQLKNPETIPNIAKSIYRREPKEEDKTEQIYAPKPIVFFANKSITPNKNDSLEKQDIDARAKFLDSSIWNYYIDFTSDKKEEKLIEVFKEIIYNYSINLYDKDINKDFIAYQSRLVKNYFSQTRDISIKPFTFHSESKIKEELQSFLEEGNRNTNDINFHINVIQNLEWKFLLVAELDGKYLTKEIIIKKLLHRIAHNIKEITNNPQKRRIKPLLNPTNNLLYSLTTVETVDEALKKLEEEQYDIILLDYLLKDDEKGAELADKLEKNKINYKKGPFGRHWIFPVTVFSEALFNDLRKDRLGHLNNNSYVNRGADPYNTPYLFLYKLVSFMNLQLKEVVFTVPHLLHLFQTFLKNVNNDKSDIKRSAGASYGELMYRFGKKSMIAYDRKEKSALAESLYCNYLRNDLDGVLQKFEHIREFLYLLAFGGIDDRTKMISELIFINEQIKPLILALEKEEYDKVKKSFNKLNNYIYNQI